MILQEQNKEKVYSDGEAVERRMLEIAENYPEELSEDFIAENCDYTTNNTFSSVRRNILNWYSFRPDASVLEIGAGMGSLTGLLCDCCARVTALEMNEARAKVIRARYPKRKNLEVVVGNVNDLDMTVQFDYVVFVGVLEYAAVFSNAQSPHMEFLKSAKRFLKADGRLLFAIENQYGLKYWCGAAEDHLQEPFVGIAGFEKPETARTFSKSALESLLKQAGFPEQRFYAALPDYKFPTMLFTDEWKPSGADLTNIAYTYGKSSLLVADERALYGDLAENDVVSFFANSFFVEASASTLDENHPVLVTARGESRPEYRIVTIINSQGTLSKKAANPLAQAHLCQIDRNEKALAQAGVSVLTGVLHDHTLSRPLADLPRADKMFLICVESRDFDGIWRLTEALRSALLKSSPLSYSGENALIKEGIASQEEDFGPILEQGYVDMTFYNAFAQGDTLVFFDQEWCVSHLPLEFILYYAVKTVFQRGKPSRGSTQGEVLRHLNISENRWTLYDRLEEAIWKRVLLRQGDLYGDGGYCTQYHNTPKLHDAVNVLRHENQQLHRDLEILRGELQCKEGHVELLIQSERDLQAEVSRRERIVQSQVEELARREQIEQSLAEELTRRERIAHTQAEEISQLTGAKIQLMDRISTLDTELAKKTDHVEQLLHAERDLQNETARLQQEVLNKEGHIQQLLGPERELARIKASRSWRFMGYVWKTRDILIPQGSKRRLIAKMTVKFLKHPLRFLGKCSPKRVAKFLATLRREGAEGVSRRLDDCLIGNALPQTQLVVEAVDSPVDGSASEQVKTAADYAVLSVPQWEQPAVSIVIPVYNQFAYTYACVKSILENSGEVTYEILIADDCSTDLTREIDQIIHGLCTIHNPENLRFLRNCNHAAKQARGEYILFLNNDTQVQANWLAPLVELLEKNETIGMTGSKLVYPDGLLQEAGGIFWKDGSAWNYGNRSNPDEPEYNYVKDVDYISGAAICIRRTLWEEFGGFDERFAPAYCEDSDLAFAVRKHGKRVVYQPLSVVVHFEGVSNGTDTSTGQKSYQVVNQKKFYEKWKDVLEAEHFNNGENVFLARDRSRNKKTLLMVDHYVPMYDKDAGSRTVYQYIQLLTDMGYNVKFIGDNFYPHQPYTQKLQQMGVEVLCGPYYANHWKDWLKENAASIGYAFLNRPHIAPKYIDEIRKYTPAKIVYYGHDLHFLRERREYEITGDQALLKSSEDWKNKELTLMRKADVVFTLSEDERHIINNEIQMEKAIISPIFYYQSFFQSPVALAGKKDLLFVGGFGHHPNEDGVLWFVEKIWPQVRKSLQSCRFIIVGSNPTERIQALASEDIIVTGYVSDETLENYYASCRLCVIPLRYGAGVKGKTIEAMYRRIPIVSTHIGTEGLHGIDAYLPSSDTEEAFVRRIVALYQDDLVAGKEAEGYCQYVREHFSYESAKNLFEQVFRGEGVI